MCIDTLGSVLEGRPRGEGADLFRIPAWKAAATSDRPNRWQGRGTESGRGTREATWSTKKKRNTKRGWSSMKREST